MKTPFPYEEWCGQFRRLPLLSRQTKHKNHSYLCAREGKQSKWSIFYKLQLLLLIVFAAESVTLITQFIAGQWRESIKLYFFILAKITKVAHL